jgi:DNA repair photolyase
MQAAAQSADLFAPAAPGLVGIARLAAEGHALAEGHDVEYKTLPARSLLNRCTSPRMPFTWTVNPYRGCEFACKYCYARYTHEFMELRDPLDFERKIHVKQFSRRPGDDAPFADPAIAAQLRRDLRRVRAGESIAIGTATDPYQPAERRYGVTRAVLEEFARHEGYDIGIVSKSTLLLRDVDVLQRVAERNQLFVNLTITTLDAGVARTLEPRAPRPDLRLDVVRKLNAAGVPAGVICAPVLPGITDSPRALEALVRATAEAGGKYIFANALFLKPCSAQVFLPFLRERYPELVADYEQRYATRAFLDQAYRRNLSRTFARLRRKYGIVEESNEPAQRAQKLPPSAAQPQQLRLFAS